MSNYLYYLLWLQSHISRDKAPKLSFTATHRAIPLLNLKYGKKENPMTPAMTLMTKVTWKSFLLVTCDCFVFMLHIS